jgi:hypothetical protein
MQPVFKGAHYPLELLFDFYFVAPAIAAKEEGRPQREVGSRRQTTFE